MAINLDNIIALLLIERVKSFRDSYSLTKVLAWKFDIIGFTELIRRLSTEELITTKTISGINNYEITDKGKLYLEKNIDAAKPLILEKYSTEEDFITSLFL